MYHKKAQYVENFNDFLIMIFLNMYLKLAMKNILL